MVDLNVEIYELLKGICAVSPEFPSMQDEFPVITYAQTSNTERLTVEGSEWLSEITYQVDVWDNADSRERVEQIAAEVSAVMSQHHFWRVMGRGFRDNAGLHRVTMQFRITVANVFE